MSEKGFGCLLNLRGVGIRYSGGDLTGYLAINFNNIDNDGPLTLGVAG